MWNPFRSKLAAGIVGGIENIYMKPGSKVLYLGAASGTTVSHVADLVGPVSYIYISNAANNMEMMLLLSSSFFLSIILEMVIKIYIV